MQCVVHNTTQQLEVADFARHSLVYWLLVTGPKGH